MKLKPKKEHKVEYPAKVAALLIAGVVAAGGLAACTNDGKQTTSQENLGIVSSDNPLLLGKALVSQETSGITSETEILVTEGDPAPPQEQEGLINQ